MKCVQDESVCRTVNKIVDIVLIMFIIQHIALLINLLYLLIIDYIGANEKLCSISCAKIFAAFDSANIQHKKAFVKSFS